MTESEKFEHWCIVEIMGHQRYAGMVSEQTIGGASFIRVDVPEIDGQKGFTKMFGSGSIYCITPCEEYIARGAAAKFGQRPIEVFDLPKEWREKLRARPALAAAGQIDDEDDDTDYHD